MKQNDEMLAHKGQKKKRVADESFAGMTQRCETLSHWLSALVQSTEYDGKHHPAHDEQDDLLVSRRANAQIRASMYPCDGDAKQDVILPWFMLPYKHKNKYHNGK